MGKKQTPFKSNHISKIYYILVLVLSGVIVCIPDINFQSGMAQGDHGRDLYIVKEVFLGAKPYQDYWWPYGPLMPYYYSLFFKALGICPQSIMIGSMFLQIASGIFFFLALTCFISPLMAFVGSIWFFVFNPKFTHTYNHIGAVALFTPYVYSLIRYSKTQRHVFLYVSLVIAILISLIKVNIGLSVFVSHLVSILVIHHVMKIRLSKDVKRYFLFSICVYTISVTSVYIYFLKGLHPEYLQQCFPYNNEYNPHHYNVFFPAAWKYLNTGFYYTLENWKQFFFAITASVFFVVTLFLIFWKKYPEEERRQIFAILLILLITSLFNLHEYLLTGVHYRSYWSRPFDLMLVFLCIGLALKRFPKFIQTIIIVTFIFICGYVYQGRTNWKAHFMRNTTNQFFRFPQGRFYSQNTSQWFATTHNTVAFLDQELSDNDKFIAIPYEPLYYFLLNKSCPVRHIVFFQYMKISERQQQDIIDQLEEQKVNYVLLSNRIHSDEIGLGIFGETYCQMLGEYIHAHFEDVAQFGEWEKKPGYMWDHGTRILRRKKKLFGYEDSIPQSNPSE